MNRNLPTFDAAEERNKLSHFTVQGFDLKGIVQAGANDGEEMENAVRLGVENYIAFEPLYGPYSILAKRMVEENWPRGYIAVKLGLHNESKNAVLKATDGDGKGASLFDSVQTHPEVQANWPDQTVLTGTEEVTLVRFDEWADINHFDYNQERFDTLQLDTQGNEMEILEGMGDYLQHFKYLCIELSIEPVYEGETPGAEVAEWLKERGFTLDSPIYAHNDAFFVRSDIKPTSDEIYRGRC